ncbi:hypothetical protein [Beijerinckia sp. L45]|uniref:hypothetical protein n=1 Tax=Beijerinckia sp. L45 TaxID=1641855 RepID=UPI00131D9462|nr:hypothetical protein [Beijerinckia sp. L45]
MTPSRMKDASRQAPQHDAIVVRSATVPGATGHAAHDPMTQPHLVIKRGHLGRYRFTLLTDNGRVSGEVKVENSGVSRAEQDALARAEVLQLAATLVTSTEGHGGYS